MKITRAANQQIGFTHPENRAWNHISFCQIAAPVETANGAHCAANAVVVAPGKIDRSPTGTGCCARMAVLHAKGRMKTGGSFTAISIIGSRFEGRIEAETTLAGRPAIIPSVSGRAWITGTHQLMLDPDDPYPQGYRLSDTWPMDINRTT